MTAPAADIRRETQAPVASLEGVSKDYGLGKVKVRALRGIDLAVRPAEFLVLAGPSGSGKTTLLNLLGLIDKPDSGRVVFNGKDTIPLGLNDLAPARRDSIGYIFQSFNLIPVLSVFENVEYPLILQRVPGVERRRRVEAALEKVGLAGRRKHRPSELSGGERQRTSIARAIVKKPAFILADEPTANLDSETGAAVLELMRRLNAEEGATFVFSSHDPRIIGMGRRVVHLRDGAVERIEEPGGRA
ncbi:MAG: ABC transporter ATP-binding protein [Candidatus Aminicenantes bacterium]|nr:ABC transporter ATP-binding protein [Candidatus Aminicenantes bacterium]